MADRDSTALYKASKPGLPANLSNEPEQPLYSLAADGSQSIMLPSSPLTHGTGSKSSLISKGSGSKRSLLSKTTGGSNSTNALVRAANAGNEESSRSLPVQLPEETHKEEDVFILILIKTISYTLLGISGICIAIIGFLSLPILIFDSIEEIGEIITPTFNILLSVSIVTAAIGFFGLRFLRKLDKRPKGYVASIKVRWISLGLFLLGLLFIGATIASQVTESVSLSTPTFLTIIATGFWLIALSFYGCFSAFKRKRSHATCFFRVLVFNVLGFSGVIALLLLEFTGEQLTQALILGFAIEFSFIICTFLSRDFYVTLRELEEFAELRKAAEEAARVEQGGLVTSAPPVSGGGVGGGRGGGGGGTLSSASAVSYSGVSGGQGSVWSASSSSSSLNSQRQQQQPFSPQNTPAAVRASLPSQAPASPSSRNARPGYAQVSMFPPPVGETSSQGQGQAAGPPPSVPPRMHAQQEPVASDMLSQVAQSPGNRRYTDESIATAFSAQTGSPAYPSDNVSMMTGTNAHNQTQGFYVGTGLSTATNLTSDGRSVGTIASSGSEYPDPIPFEQPMSFDDLTGMAGAPTPQRTMAASPIQNPFASSDPRYSQATISVGPNHTHDPRYSQATISVGGGGTTGTTQQDDDEIYGDFGTGVKMLSPNGGTGGRSKRRNKSKSPSGRKKPSKSPSGRRRPSKSPSRGGSGSGRKPSRSPARGASGRKLVKNDSVQDIVTGGSNDFT